MHRTTLLLDEDSQRAARELALKLNCSTSEAIRRSIVRYRDQMKGVSPERRKERTHALERLVELSDGNDAAEEIRRLKAEDKSF